MPSSRTTGPLPTHLGRLAHTLLVNPGIAYEPLRGKSRPLDAVYRDLPPAAPVTNPDGGRDNAEMRRSHEGVTDGAKRAAGQCRRQTDSATERRLAPPVPRSSNDP
ncbi:hypothetical protein [Streptomyces werraensis]|uniref:hypothetical protein n=1 Tax=Streptomyces werraensis TaxID=68284 RepID=UPI0037FD76CD